MKPLDDNIKFKDWLSKQSDSRNFGPRDGLSMRAECCPLASFLREVYGWKYARISTDYSNGLGNQPCHRTPSWAQKFINRFDTDYPENDERTGANAKRILSLIESSTQ